VWSLDSNLPRNPHGSMDDASENRDLGQSKWHSGAIGTLAEVQEKYARQLHDSDLINDIHELRGRNQLHVIVKALRPPTARRGQPDQDRSFNDCCCAEPLNAKR